MSVRSILRKIQRMDAVYWSPVGDDNYGKPVYGNPVAVKCRWEDIQEEFLNREGRLELCLAKVFVDRDVAVRGVLWLGTLATINPSNAPFDNEGAIEIRSFNKIPDRKVQAFVRIAYLGVEGVSHGSGARVR